MSSQAATRTGTSCFAAPLASVLERRIHTSAQTRPVKAILCTRFGTPDDLVLADIDEGGDSRPTLKRRSPASDDPNAPVDTPTDQTQERPQLKRRTSEPEPTPSPSPEK